MKVTRLLLLCLLPSLLVPCGASNLPAVPVPVSTALDAQDKNALQQPLEELLSPPYTIDRLRDALCSYINALRWYGPSISEFYDQIEGTETQVVILQNTSSDGQSYDYTLRFADQVPRMYFDVHLDQAQQIWLDLHGPDDSLWGKRRSDALASP